MEISKEKQIEEMAKDICRVEERCIVGCQPTPKCRAFKYAERAYAKGYRLASDVAREIFAEIETSLCYKLIGGEMHLVIREEDYLHYKKKYTEGEKDK